MQRLPNRNRDESKIVISDWGGVVSHAANNWTPWWEIYVREVKSGLIGIDIKEILVAVRKINKQHEIEKTQDEACISAYYSDLAKVLESPFKADEMRRKYRELSLFYGCYDHIGDYIRSLRDLCKTGVLSNLRKDDERVINSHMRFQFWDYVWLSYEIGSEKPEYSIYERVMEDCRIKPEKILFIEDRKENIIAAKKMGWNTYAIEEEGNLVNIENAVNQFLKQK